MSDTSIYNSIAARTQGDIKTASKKPYWKDGFILFGTNNG